MKKKAVVLLSGGLDSITCLAIAQNQEFDVYAISFDYNQRHKVELEAAKKIVKLYGVKDHKIINIDLSLFGGSALTDMSIAVPKNNLSGEIPVTYVPCRNLIFLSLAAAYAETIGALDIFFGANQIDYSNYPDCRERFVEAFQITASLGSKLAETKERFRINTPLIKLSKADIVKKGLEFGIDYSITVSCYDADENGRACGSCDSCLLRKRAFVELGMNDPTIYKTENTASIGA